LPRNLETIVKNTWTKTRKPENPYYTTTENAWTYKVLKVYSNPLKDHFARAFCLVITPFTGSRGELGDVYVKDVLGLAKAWKEAHPDTV
jgi:hypothetical protein